MTHVNPILNQTDFRFREDSGNEATATWLANANINISIDVDTDFRYRVVVAETAGSTNPETVNLLLEFSLNSGAFAAVTGSSSVQFATFTGSSDTDATTQQIGSGSFVAGELDNTGAVSNLDLQSSETEMEYCLTLDSGQIDNDDTIDLRVVNSGVDLNTYGNTGRATAIEVGDTLLVIQEASHLHAADNLAMNTDLTVAESLHAHTADNLAMDTNLTIAEAFHAHTADNITLEGVILVLNPQSVITDTDGTTTTLSNYVVPAGDDKILTVVVSNEGGSEIAASTVKHNGVDLTHRDSIALTSGASNSCEIWDLQLGSSTPSGDIVVVWDSSTNASGIGAVTLTEVNQQAPEATNAATAAADTINTAITTITDSAIIVDGFSFGQGTTDLSTITQGPDQVEDISVQVGGSSLGLGLSHEQTSSSGSYTLGWTNIATTALRYAHVLVAYEKASDVITLIIAEATHAHSADNLSMNTDLTVAEALHDHTADNLAMNIDLVIDESFHAHAADNLLVQGNLEIQEASHAHTADNIDIHVDLSINDALHAHTADNVVIEAGTLLIIQDATHAHEADNLDIHIDLAIDETNHAMTSDNLAMGIDLSIQEALHAHAAENLDIVVDLFINDTLHGHTADNLTIGIGLVNLVINDALMTTTSDDISLIRTVGEFYPEFEAGGTWNEQSENSASWSSQSRDNTIYSDQ